MKCRNHTQMLKVKSTSIPSPHQDQMVDSNFKNYAFIVNTLFYNGNMFFVLSIPVAILSELCIFFYSQLHFFVFYVSINLHSFSCGTRSFYLFSTNEQTSTYLPFTHAE